MFLYYQTLSYIILYYHNIMTCIMLHYYILYYLILYYLILYNINIILYYIILYYILSEWGEGPTAYFIPGRVGWGVGPRQIVVCLSVVCRLLSVCRLSVCLSPPLRPTRDPPATHPNRWSNNTNNNNVLLV